jgi:hypothetical protein
VALAALLAPNNVVTYTSKELHDIAARHTPGKEGAKAILVPDDWEVVPIIFIIDQGVKKGAKGGKRRQKMMPSVGCS